MVVDRSSPIFQDTLRRTLAGKGPDPTASREVIREVEKLIAERPGLRAELTGAVPTGLSPEGRKAFREATARRLGVLVKAKEPIITKPQEKTVPFGFIGPLPKGVTRAPKIVPRGFIGPLPKGVTRAPKIVPRGFIGPLKPGEVRVQIKDAKKTFIVDEKILKGRPTAPGETIQIRTIEDIRKLNVDEGTFATFARALETAEVTVFPSIIGPKFLSSQLGAQLTSGQISDAQRENARRVNELLDKTAGFGPEASKASLELLRLIRETDNQIRNDLIKAKRVGRNFDEVDDDFEKISDQLNEGKISEKTAMNRERILLKNLKSKGFRIDEKNGKVNISHPVYDRLQGLTSSAWRNLLKDARKGDSPIKDQAFIGSLDFLNKAFQAEKILLTFQLAGIGAGSLGLSTPLLTGGATARKIFSTTAALSSGALVTSFGALRGAITLKETGEPLLAITSALGTITGFTSPAILRKTNNLLKAITKRIDEQPPIALSKKARVGRAAKAKQVVVQKAKAKKKLQITKKQALTEFSKDTRSKQIEILEKSFRNEQVTPENLRKAKQFMIKSGLKDFQAEDRLAEMLRRLQVRYLRESKQLGIIQESQFKIDLQKLRQGKQKLISLLKEKTIQADRPKLLIKKTEGGFIRRERDFSVLTREVKQVQVGGFQRRVLVNIRNRITNINKVKGRLKFELKSATTTIQKRQLQTRVDTLSRQAQDLQTRLAQNTLTTTLQLTNQLQNSKTRQDSLTKQLSRTTNALARENIARRINQEQQLQRNITRQIRRIPRRPVARPVKIRIPVPFIFGFPKAKPKKKKRPPITTLKKQGYNAFAKQKGLFKKLNKVPLTKKQAQNLSAWIVDNSTSARGKIRRVPGKKAKKPTLKIPQGYFSKTKNKYRFFKVSKGKRVPLKNEFIEKKGRRIDTKGEKRGLSVARAVAKLKRPKTKPITRRTKTTMGLRATRLIKFKRR